MAGRVGGIRQRVTGLQAKMLSCCWCKTRICALGLPAGRKSRSGSDWDGEGGGTQGRRYPGALTRGAGSDSGASADLSAVVVISLSSEACLNIFH